MLYHQIKEIYPDIKDEDFRLQDESDGKGAYIKEWKSDKPIPMKEELLQVKDTAENKVKFRELRLKRNNLLSQNDWVFVRHKTQLDLGITPNLDPSKYNKYLIYMQALRDLPATVDINNTVFPVNPLSGEI